MASSLVIGLAPVVRSCAVDRFFLPLGPLGQTGLHEIATAGGVLEVGVFDDGGRKEDEQVVLVPGFRLEPCRCFRRFFFVGVLGRFVLRCYGLGWFILCFLCDLFVGCIKRYVKRLDQPP